MLYVKTGGIDIPSLGFGTYELTGTDCIKMVKTALELGYRHLDTAQIYHNENEVGMGIMDSHLPRGDIFLTTKVWMDKLHHDDVISSTEESLRKLKTDYVDLLLIHWPNEAVPLEETLGAMKKLKEQGKTRLIGVSNFTVPLLREAVEILDGDIACNQVEYHPYLSQKPLLHYMRKHGMALTAYSPLARGEVNAQEVLAAIAEKYQKAPSQIALRWLVQQDGVCAIPKTAHKSYAQSNLDIFDFELADDDMATIHALGTDHRLIDPDWAPRWDAA